MDSFVLLAYASLAASRTLLQWLLACLNFTLDSEDWFCWYKRKKWFLWTMAAAQAGLPLDFKNLENLEKAFYFEMDLENLEN